MVRTLEGWQQVCIQGSEENEKVERNWPPEPALCLWDTGLGLGSHEVWVCLISLGHFSTPSPGSLEYCLLLFLSHRMAEYACLCPFLGPCPPFLKGQSLFLGKHFVAIFPLHPSHSLLFPASFLVGEYGEQWYPACKK